MAPTILAGDCLDHLRAMPDASVDAVITDPPYGLSDLKPAGVTAAVTAWTSGDREHVPDAKGFMGRAWDAFVPPPAVWDECLRVLRPGGHLLCFAGTRTVDLMGLSIRLAGFTIRDSITWHHGQGFPKGKAQLKPASEPILVARKAGPLWLNIDAARVAGPAWSFAHGPKTGRTGGGIMGEPMAREGVARSHAAGRWPANVVLSHGECDGECQPGCPVAELDAQSGNARSSGVYAGDGSRQPGDHSTDFGGGHRPVTMYADSGGASRFFPTFKYQAKAPTSERPKVAARPKLRLRADLTAAQREHVLAELKRAGVDIG